MPIQCTDAEWKILEVLWDRSPRTMSEIMKTLEPTMGWTRHTVISLLKRMEDKGTVKVDESGGIGSVLGLKSGDPFTGAFEFLDRIAAAFDGIDGFID